MARSQGTTGTSQSLERGLAILSSFHANRSLIGVSELSRGLDLSRSTAHRYVTTLAKLGYLQQDPESKRYRLGPKVLDLGFSALNSMDLLEISAPYLRQLSDETQHTVNLAILDGTEVVYIERCRTTRPGQQDIDLNLHVGARLPAYCTAMGKLLLAYLPDRERRELMTDIRLERRAPGTITNRRLLAIEFERIREEGYAVNDQELTPGLHSIAAPIRSDSREVVAATNMAAHSSMISLQDLIDHLGPHLIATADRISARLGYRRDDELAAAGSG